MAGKERIDVLIARLGMAPSRERAQALVMAGHVSVGGCRIDKPGTRVPVDAAVEIDLPDHPYVGRGGLKLEGALDDLGVDCAGLRCLDIGASTGGFTDCLLRRGAAHVVAVDVGTNQLDWRLRRDPRVTSLEQTDARSLTRAHMAPLQGPLDLVVADASFISLRLLLPVIPPLMDPGARLLALVKPQFEVGRELVGKGGLVRDDALRLHAVEGVLEVALAHGFRSEGRCDSRLAGARSGNREVFILARYVGAC